MESNWERGKCIKGKWKNLNYMKNCERGKKGNLGKLGKLEY